MANWKKVIVSGSDASLNSLIVAAGPLSVTGSSVISGSFNAYGVVGLSGSVTIQGETSLTGQLIITGSASGSFSGSFAGDGSQLTGVVAQNANSLSNSTGISTFTYNGSAPTTVSVSGAAALSTDAVTKWSGNAFVNSSITDGLNVTINNGGGVYIQGGGLDVSGSSTFHDNLTVQGNLVVNGTASFQNTTNLEVADQFILLNSGSGTFEDSGIIINTGNTGNSGSAWYLETSGTTTGTAQNGRFAVASGVAPDATTATPDEYANTTRIDAGDPFTQYPVPQWGGTGLGQGNMYVDTVTGDIYIYA